MARVLIVDDDPDILRVAERVLETAQHDILTANNAIHALDLLNRLPFDLVISDANMPQCSGFQLIEDIRKNSRWAHLSVAMLTSLRNKKDIDRAIHLGVDDYIVKPIDPVVLANKVNRLVERKSQKESDQIELPRLSPLRKARLLHGAEVISVGPTCLIIESDHPLHENTLIEVRCGLFDSIGIKPMSVRLISVKKINGNHWKGWCSYNSSQHDQIKKLKLWMKHQPPKRFSA